MNFEIRYFPNEGQTAFHASKARYKCMVGSLGSGKTATGCVEGILLNLEYPGNVGLIARKTLPELKNTTLKRFFDFLPDPLILNWNKTDRELKMRSNGEKPSIIHFGPLDDVSRYKSMDIGWFFIDEADEVDQDLFLMLAGRLRIPNVRLCGMLATNPTTKHHWIYKTWVDEKKPNFELFRSKTKDNAHNLPPDYIDHLVNTYPPDWVQRYVEGEFGLIQTGDPAYPDFRVNLHVKPITHTMGRTLLRGWDFGYNHPAVVWAEFDDRGRFLILDSILGSQTDLDVFANEVIRKTNVEWPGAQIEDFCDPSGIAKKDTGRPSISILHQSGVFPRFAMSNPEERCGEIRKLMRQTITGVPCFQIHPKNDYLIEGLVSGIQYEVDSTGGMVEKIRKDGYYEHGNDAMGYIISNTCMRTNPASKAYDIEISEPKWVSYGR